MARDDNLSVPVLRPKKLKETLEFGVPLKIPVFIWGAPGIGKSQIVQQVADAMGYGMRDIRLALFDPTDVKGIPYMDIEVHKMKIAPPSELPSKEEAKDHKGIIVFFDELNSAPPTVQAAAYQLILDRRCGEYELPDNCVIIAAGNRESDRAIVNRLPTPLMNRFIHTELKIDFDHWKEWAQKDENIHPLVIDYLSQNRKQLFDFDPKNKDTKAFPTPRSWEFVSRIVKSFTDKFSVEALQDNSPEKEQMSFLVEGSIGVGVAASFLAFVSSQRKHLTAEQVLSGVASTKIVHALTVEQKISLVENVSGLLPMRYLRSRDGKVDENSGKEIDLAAEMNNFSKFLNHCSDEVMVLFYKKFLGPDVDDQTREVNVSLHEWLQSLPNYRKSYPDFFKMSEKISEILGDG